METINIWGIKITLASKSEIVSSVHKMLDSGRRSIHITGVNPETIVSAQTIPILHDAIMDSDIVNIDNMLVWLRLKINGYKAPERAATPDVFSMLLKGAEDRGESVYFLGAEQVVLEKMIDTIRSRYPKLIVAGYRNGYYGLQEEQDIANEIGEKKPTYLFLGLPTPAKESFIMKYKRQIDVGVLYGVGGAFDVLGEKVKRAPAWACNIGLEGIIRVLQAPRDYGRRVLVFYPKFLKSKTTNI